MRSETADDIKRTLKRAEREINDIADDSRQVAWILTACDGNDSAGVSIVGKSDRVMALLTQVLVNIALDEDDPLETLDELMERIGCCARMTIKTVTKLEHSHMNKEAIKSFLEDLMDGLED